MCVRVGLPAPPMDHALSVLQRLLLLAMVYLACPVLLGPMNHPPNSAVNVDGCSSLVSDLVCVCSWVCVCSCVCVCVCVVFVRVCMCVVCVVHTCVLSLLLVRGSSLTYVRAYVHTYIRA